MSRQVSRRQAEAGFQSNLPSVLNHIYSCRGITSTNELDLSLNNLMPPDSFMNIRDAFKVVS